MLIMSLKGKTPLEPSEQDLMPLVGHGAHNSVGTSTCGEASMTLGRKARLLALQKRQEVLVPNSSIVLPSFRAGGGVSD